MMEDGIMDTTLKSLSLMASLTALAWAAQSGCVCPPCPGPGAAAPVAGAAAGAGVAAGAGAAAGQASSGEASKPAAAGSRLVIWDGDGHTVGSGAKSWADCDKKPDCKVTMAAAKGSGKEGSTGLKLSTNGPGWKGGGWNWFGWWPETSGTDLTPYQNLSFWMRLEAKTPDALPEPGAVTVRLVCSKGKKSSFSVPMDRFGKDLPDGQWHKITIPISELLKGEGKDFDPGTAWEFGVGVWTAEPRTFDIDVDEIAVENP
jgi:hypothetical protein